MKKVILAPAAAVRPIVNLAPGSFVHGTGGKELYFTVLGSCVSLIIWHPASRFYAMCHYINACTPPHGDVSTAVKGKYADQILPYFWQLVGKHKLPPHELVLTLTGGAASSGSQQLQARFQVAQSNLALAGQFLSQHQLVLTRCDTGGSQARRVKFYSDSGRVDIIRLPEAQAV